MGKRSKFQRNPRDFYPTPAAAVQPLLPFLFEQTYFIEPCCGDNALVRHLESAGHSCTLAADIEVDARTSQYVCRAATHFITNPPWSREILHPIITNLRQQLPTWLLIDADWMHTRQSSDYMKFCQQVVSIGRVKWIPDSKFVGKDNACWYLFVNEPCLTHFVGR